MAATYDPGHGTSRDRVRFVLGDTDVANPLLQDAEIDSAIDEYGLQEGAAICATSIAALYAQRATQYDEAEGLKVTYDKRAEHYRALARDLRRGIPQLERRTTRSRAGSRHGVMNEPDMRTWRDDR